MSNARDKANIPSLNFSSTGIDDNATSTAITIDSSENVGIGATSPSTKLDVEGTGVPVEINSSNSNTYKIQFSDNGTIRGYIGSSSSSPIRFANGSASELMRIDSSGNVGIGTSSPSTNLQIEANDNLTTTFPVKITNLAGSGFTELGCYAINTSAVDLVLQAGGNEGLRIDKDNGNVGIGTSSPSLELEVIGDIKSNGITSRTSLQGVNPTPTDNNSYELSNGYLNLYRDDTATVKTILFGKNGSEVGNITTTGSTTAYNTSSDYRLKENVVDLTNATERLKQLQPKRFNFIKDADTTVDGFIAHEVSSVVPEAVTGTHNEVKTWKEYDELPEGVSVGDNKLDENGNTIPEYQGIDQAKLVPLLVKTIQELEARITALETNQP